MQRHTVSGFTMVELLITLVIAAISLSLGVPSFMQFVNKNELSSASTEIVNTLQDARERAVSSDSSVTVTQDTQGLTCEYSEDDTDYACDGVDLTSADVSISRDGDSGTITFDPSGMTTGDLTLTLNHNDISSYQFEIRILRSGRISINQKTL